MKYTAGIVSVAPVLNVYSVVYNGEGISTNDYYSGASGKNGWRIRQGIKKRFSLIFTHLLASSDLPWMDQYMVFLRYNSKMDPDNTIGGLGKLMLDSLKQERLKGVVTKKGWVYDDSKKYNKGIMTIPEDNLAHNTYIFDILHLK